MEERQGQLPGAPGLVVNEHVSRQHDPLQTHLRGSDAGADAGNVPHLSFLRGIWARLLAAPAPRHWHLPRVSTRPSTGILNLLLC